MQNTIDTITNIEDSFSSLSLSLNNNTLKNNLFSLLKTNKSFVDERGELLPDIILLKSKKQELISLLLSNEEIKKYFFYNIDGITLFKEEEFIFYIKNKSYFNNSYTSFDNKIGFNNQKQLDNNVVLNFPYKDCILEGGQTKADKSKRQEIFFNEILAKDEIKRLLEPKILTNFIKYTKNGNEKIQNFNRNKDGIITDNLLIKGNNLITLYSLVEEFRGKIKLIYIDPPYNTGNDDFTYNDNFNHSTWLCFMKNRLEIARELLRDDGVIFIQCDDNEQAYLKVLCDEVFGRDTDCIIWQKMDARYDQNTNAKIINRYKEIHEYIVICYKINKKDIFFNKIRKLPEWKNEQSNPDNDKRGKYKQGIISFEEGHKNEDKNSEYYYTITTPTGRQITRNFFISKEKFNELVKDNRIYFPKNGDGIPALKVFENEEQEYKMDSILRGFGTSGSAKDEIEKLFNNRDIFSNPKPEKLIGEIIRTVTVEKDIILDFFAGSGTTGAVAHKMGRQWIMIEQLDYIESITKERLKKVIDGEQGGISKNVNWQGGGDFIYCELKKYNENFVNMLKEAETKEDIINVFNEICNKGFVKYKIDINELMLDINKGEDSEFLKQPINEIKEKIYSILDNNMLYVSLSMMEDKKFLVTEEEKKLNKNFYNK